MLKLFARVGTETDITLEELKILVDYSVAGYDNVSDELEEKVMNILQKHFNAELDSYIPGSVIEDLAIENGIHEETNRYNDIDF